MAFTLLSEDCNLPGCPAVWGDDEDLRSAIVVGATITDPEILAQLNVGAGESAVRTHRAPHSSRVWAGWSSAPRDDDRRVHPALLDL